MTFNVYNHLYRIFNFGSKNNITHHKKNVKQTSVVSIYPVEKVNKVYGTLGNITKLENEKGIWFREKWFAK